VVREQGRGGGVDERKDAERPNPGETGNQVEVGRLVSGRKAAEIDQDSAKQGKATTADFGDCQGGVVDRAEGVAGHEEYRELEGCRDIGGCQGGGVRSEKPTRRLNHDRGAEGSDGGEVAEEDGE
jgi:hypothetical protein